MSLSREASSALNTHFSSMARSYSVTAAQIASGFNPDGVVIPKFFHGGLVALSTNEKHPLSEINIVMVEDRQRRKAFWVRAVVLVLHVRTWIRKTERRLA
nr:hypothetical protein [Vibrio parahaemolyticus]